MELEEMPSVSSAKGEAIEASKATLEVKETQQPNGRIFIIVIISKYIYYSIFL